MRLKEGICWDVPPYTNSLKMGTVIGGTIVPIKDCSYKGGHPKQYT